MSSKLLFWNTVYWTSLPRELSIKCDALFSKVMLILTFTYIPTNQQKSLRINMIQLKWTTTQKTIFPGPWTHTKPRRAKQSQISNDHRAIWTPRHHKPLETSAIMHLVSKTEILDIDYRKKVGTSPEEAVSLVSLTFSLRNDKHACSVIKCYLMRHREMLSKLSFLILML